MGRAKTRVLNDSGLKMPNFVRYGVMHRNTYINSPTLLNKYYQMEKYPKVFFAGQITGVEGYVESASSGILAGYNMAAMLNGKDMFEPDSKLVSVHYRFIFQILQIQSSSL